MAKAMTQAAFLDRAKRVHGDIYDYGKTCYVNMRQKVLITCKLHGDFTQMPQAHLNGQGCPACGREKQKQTMLRTYGVDNPMKDKAIFAKARETCKERYGTEWARSNPAVQAKGERTNLEKYGVKAPLQDAGIRAKQQDTVKARYGMRNISQVSVFRDKARETCLDRYGTEEPLGSPMIREKIIATNQGRYGGKAPLVSKEIQAKAEATCLARYGVRHVTQSDEVQRKILCSKAERGTFHTSESEEVLYRRLLDAFGEGHVLRQYVSDLYPFACDFYIPFRDLYIELNASWTHGGRWFDRDSLLDVVVVTAWNEKGTAYYQNAVHTWTAADVKKRETARRNTLNYVVFWDSGLQDAELWFKAGCPDSHDWDRMYDWSF